MADPAVRRELPGVTGETDHRRDERPDVLGLHLPDDDPGRLGTGAGRDLRSGHGELWRLYEDGEPAGSLTAVEADAPTSTATPAAPLVFAPVLALVGVVILGRTWRGPPSHSRTDSRTSPSSSVCSSTARRSSSWTEWGE